MRFYKMLTLDEVKRFKVIKVHKDFDVSLIDLNDITPWRRAIYSTSDWYMPIPPISHFEEEEARLKEYIWGNVLMFLYVYPKARAIDVCAGRFNNWFLKERKGK